MAQAARPLPAGRKLALAAEILAVYVRIRALMRRIDVRAAVARLREQGDVVRVEDDLSPFHTAARLGHAVARTLAPLPTDARCLARSLVLTRLLARRGIASTLVIGVRPEPFEAHAWVEFEGIAVLPDDGGEFGRLTEL